MTTAGHCEALASAFRMSAGSGTTLAHARGFAFVKRSQALVALLLFSVTLGAKRRRSLAVHFRSVGVVFGLVGEVGARRSLPRRAFVFE
jgi:hypothetical protein